MKLVWLGLGLVALWTFKPAEANNGANALTGVAIPLFALIASNVPGVKAGHNPGGFIGTNQGDIGFLKYKLQTALGTTDKSISIGYELWQNQSNQQTYEIYRDGVFAFDQTVGDAQFLLSLDNLDYGDYFWTYWTGVEDEGYVNNVNGVAELEPGTTYNYTVVYRGINMTDGGVINTDTLSYNLCTRCAEPVVTFTDVVDNTTTMNYSLNPANGAGGNYSSWYFFINSTDGDFFETNITTSNTSGSMTFNVTMDTIYTSWTTNWKTCPTGMFNGSYGRGYQEGSQPSITAMVMFPISSAAVLTANMALLSLAAWIIS